MPINGAMLRLARQRRGFHQTDAAPKLDEMSLEDVERALITKALARHEGNVSLAAQALGLSRSALYRRLQRHGL